MSVLICLMKKEFEGMPNLGTKKKMVYKQGKGMWWVDGSGSALWTWKEKDLDFPSYELQ